MFLPSSPQTPSVVTLNSLLNVYSYADRINTSMRFLNLYKMHGKEVWYYPVPLTAQCYSLPSVLTLPPPPMCAGAGLRPNTSSFASLMYMLCRNGKLMEACLLKEGLPKDVRVTEQVRGD